MPRDMTPVRADLKVENSDLASSLELFITGKGSTDYINELRKAINRPNTGQNEWERGIQEGVRRACMDLINVYDKVK